MKNVSHEFDEFLYSMHEHFSYQSIGYGAIIDFLMRKRLEIKTLKRLYYESKESNDGRYSRFFKT